MKHIFPLIMIIVLCTGFLGCRTGNRTGAFTLEQENFDTESSYALGMDIGSFLSSQNIYPNMDEFMQGIMDILTNSQTRYTLEQSTTIIQEAFSALAQEAENVFLEENSRNPGIIITESGLQYEVINEGSGERPTAESTVLVHYEGSLTDGMVFDSSHYRGEPAEVNLGAVIPGWTEGLQLMSVGSTYRFVIPSELGYGPFGAGQLIPPFATLIFEIELLDIISNE